MLSLAAVKVEVDQREERPRTGAWTIELYMEAAYPMNTWLYAVAYEIPPGKSNITINVTTVMPLNGHILHLPEVAVL